MEYAAGKTLKEKLRDQGSLSVHLSIFLFKKICVALKFFHEKYGIIHRDLKPENIMVLTGNTGIKIFDYGVSLNKKNLSEEEKKHFTNYGTFPYLNPKLIEISKNRKPEEIFELIDYTFDIYSIGIIFYEMLIGTKPF
jgi:serine/threonine-protein kinase